MIDHNILHPLITNFNIKFLEKKDPTDQSWFVKDRYGEPERGE
jgi:hypothetical protein